MKRFIIFLCCFLGWSHSEAKDPPRYSKQDLLGDIDPASHRDFEKIRAKYTTKAEAYLREEVYDAFKEMWKAARKDGIDLIIISATRNRAYQRGIWNRKWNTFGGEEEERARRILEYSSMPGISRHHWGTDFDLNALNNEFFESGEGLAIYQWLQEHAAEYGFYQPYTAFNDFRDAGYHEEKWHWSYYPLANKFSRAYRAMIDYEDLQGFSGDRFAEQFGVINTYVFGVEASRANR